MSDERDRLDIEVRKVAELERLLAVARAWRKCPLHGDIDGARQWGCPDCVAELRSAKRQLEAEKAECAEALRLCQHELAFAKMPSGKADYFSNWQQCKNACKELIKIQGEQARRLNELQESLHEAQSALEGLLGPYITTQSCFCGLSIGNPMYKEHSGACMQALEALEKLKRTEGM